MIGQDDVRKLVGKMDEPFLHIPLGELDAIKEISLKPEKEHVSLKVAIAKTGTAEQMKLQQDIVQALKAAGANTVGLRFEELPQETLEKALDYYQLTLEDISDRLVEHNEINDRTY